MTGIRILLFISMLVTSRLEAKQHPVTIMLDPAGHARNTGRKLANGFERAETLKLAESLSTLLEDRYKLKVVFTRSPGEEIVPLQNASFANRLDVDFFLSLHIYKEESAKPKIFAYHLVFNPIADFALRTIDPLSFIPVHQAHFMSIQRTVFAGNMMRSTLLRQEYQKLFDFYGLYGIPLKPLVGMSVPALLLEIGINEDDKWQSLVEPIIDSLFFLTRSM